MSIGAFAAFPDLVAGLSNLAAANPLTSAVGGAIAESPWASLATPAFASAEGVAGAEAAAAASPWVTGVATGGSTIGEVMAGTAAATEAGAGAAGAGAGAAGLGAAGTAGALGAAGLGGLAAGWGIAEAADMAKGGIFGKDEYGADRSSWDFFSEKSHDAGDWVKGATGSDTLGDVVGIGSSIATAPLAAAGGLLNGAVELGSSAASWAAGLFD